MMVNKDRHVSAADGERGASGPVIIKRLPPGRHLQSTLSPSSLEYICAFTTVFTQACSSNLTKYSSPSSSITVIWHSGADRIPATMEGSE